MLACIRFRNSFILFMTDDPAKFILKLVKQFFLSITSIVCEKKHFRETPELDIQLRSVYLDKISLPVFKYSTIWE